MKTITAILATLLLGAFTLSAEETPADSGKEAGETILVAEVQGMVCAFCAQGIDRSLSKLDEVDGVFINLKKKVVAVAEKKDATLPDDQMKKIITDAGFSVKSLKRQPGTLKKLEEDLDQAS